MFILITYDVKTEDATGQKRLRKVAKACKNYGHRVQNSVFECILSEANFIILKNEIESVIDKENDSVRFYFLGKNWNRHIEHIGRNTGLDVTETLII